METFCSYCCVMASNEADLKAHCMSETHQLTIMSDEGREWKFRAPPRGVGADQYAVCPIFSVSGKCRLNQLCCDAHGEEELNEWKERFDYRQMKLQHAKERQLQGGHYSEQLLEKWLTSSNPNQIMKERLENVEVAIEPESNITVSEKNCVREWTFRISAKATLRHVALLYETHRTHFRLSQIISGRLSSDIKEYNVGAQCQEWSNADSTDYNDGFYTCKVRFVTSIYGTFRQAIVFDFGFEPVLIQKLSVDVVSVSDLEKLQQARESIVSFTERWSNNEVTVVPFENRPYKLGEKEECLLSCYSAPNAAKFTVTQSVMEPTLTKSNYSARQHELLCIEEMAQYELLSRYNVKAHLNLTSCYLLTPNSAATAKYAHNGELFANMQLSSVLSEDSASGRLVLTNCSTVLLAPVKTKGEEHRKVYEAIIEDKGKTVIYIRLSKQCVEELKLKPDRELLTEVQFQLNRLPLCEMHFAVDRLHPPSIVFPDINLVPPISWNADSTWATTLDARLNPKQKEAVQAIITPISVRLPPVLIIGPFGTGKTFTLAQAVKLILNDPQSRILVCTHSNSAADIYIREYLHPQVQEGCTEATPLRIYYRHRWVATVHKIVLNYCLIATTSNDRSFIMPTVEDVKKYRVIVTTLSTSRYLVQLGLEKGFFTHILIDEAAQAMECEAIMPLSLANENTRVVLAGDHMQLSPEVYSQFAQQRNLHTSLLERLYDLYPEDLPCKVLLCENYRSHEAIIQYTSELFYDNHLKASGLQPRHEKYFPLTFFTTRGEDVQDLNSTAFHNNAEVYEIVERVIELKKSWPAVWGEQDETSIGVVTPYYDQVVRIRAELRKKKLNGISVERVLNVQGKQYRVIFLSAVRTRQTCNGSKSESDLDHGFLSNARLLNTAITRAQSLVAVVGDPISLCSVGKCRKLWEKFILTCHQENSLFGITWDSLRSQLDSLELKKNFILNPLAPEFVPGRPFHGQLNITSAGGEFFIPPSTPHQPPWVLLSLPQFQATPMLQPAVAHMMPPHPYNVGINCIGAMPPAPPPPPPPHPFQPFSYNPTPPPPRPSAIQPRMPSGIFPRRLGNLRGSVMPLDQGTPVKDFDRGTMPGRQIKRGDGYTLFNNTHKQPGVRMEDRIQNHSEHEEIKRVLGRNEHQGNLNILQDPSETLSNFRNIQNHLFCLDDKVNKLNLMKSDESINNVPKLNPQAVMDANNFNSLPEQQLLPSALKSNSLNGTWCPLPSKPFGDADVGDNIALFPPETNYHSNAENCAMRSNLNRPLLNGDISNNMINERERAMNVALEGHLSSPCPPQLQQASTCNVSEKWPYNAEAAISRLELLSQLPVVQAALHDKLSLLEKVLPPATDLKSFLESPVQPKAFFNHLIVADGPIIAKRFVNLMNGIKRDQDVLIKYQQLNSIAERAQLQKGFPSGPRNISEFPVSSPLRNMQGTPFSHLRSQASPHHSELPNGCDQFGVEMPITSFTRGFTPDKNEIRLFANGDAKNGLIKPSNNMPNQYVKTWDSMNDGCPSWNAPTFDRNNYEQLSLDLSKNLNLGNRSECISKQNFIPEGGQYFGENTMEALRRVEIEKQMRESHKQLWAPPPPQQISEHSSPAGPPQDSYLSKLRNISNSAASAANIQSMLFENSRSEAKRSPPKSEFDTPAQINALSVSYPDIPDILSSHILPNNKEAPPPSKIIRKPNPSRPLNDGPSSSSQHPSQYIFDFPLPQNNNSTMQYPHMSSEGMTYAKILRSPQP